jgi:hypothetical protein
MAKKLLILSVVGLVIGLAFVTGIVNAQSMVDLYVVLPLGAVFLGLFLVFQSFEKESSLYDEEQRAHPAFQITRVASKADCSSASPAHARSANAH